MKVHEAFADCLLKRFDINLIISGTYELIRSSGFL